ncbi:cation-transporting P-type ATPase [Thioalkalivibrio sulfidiphilus]|uniref:cation-transporting P-type ATPase n=1 Tax=Thioalkalivibrio sulfidiphilus TaxID=1033854 RepID=UPI003B33FA3B
MRFEHAAEKPMAVAGHVLDADESAARLQVVAARELEPAEAKERLAYHGENRLAEKKPRFEVARLKNNRGCRRKP